MEIKVSLLGLSHGPGAEPQVTSPSDDPSAPLTEPLGSAAPGNLAGESLSIPHVQQEQPGMIRSGSENCDLKGKCADEKNLSPYNRQCHSFPIFFSSAFCPEYTCSSVGSNIPLMYK